MKTNIREKKDNTNMDFFSDEYLKADEQIRREIINKILEGTDDKDN